MTQVRRKKESKKLNVCVYCFRHVYMCINTYIHVRVCARVCVLYVIRSKYSRPYKTTTSDYRSSRTCYGPNMIRELGIDSVFILFRNFSKYQTYYSLFCYSSTLFSHYSRYYYYKCLRNPTRYQPTNVHTIL